MAITNKFIHFNTKAKFVERYATETDDFKNKYTIFIKDTKQIWAHGGMYGGYYEFASGTDGSFTVTKPKSGIEAGTETVKVTIGKPANAGHADTAAKAAEADHADTASHASNADVATEVGADLTITNGSNTITYNGSEAKSITIAAGGGTEYTLTADKMSTAWGTNSVSGGSLSLTGSVVNIADQNKGFVLNKDGALQLTNSQYSNGVQIRADKVSGLPHGVYVSTGGVIAINVLGSPTERMDTYMSSSGVFTTGQMNAANGFFQTSDIRKKNFGSDVEVNFEELKLIPKKYFEWKDDPNEVQQIGTSAQALLRVYPQIVSKGEDGFYSVDYAKLSIIALAAIDKLNERVEKLEAEIKSIKK